MGTIRFYTERLLIVSAAIEMLLGLAIYAFPREFGAPLYDLLRPYFPQLSVGLTTGGAILLLLVRYGLGVWERRLFCLLAAAPLATLAVFWGEAGSLGARLLYGVYSLAIAAAPWLPGRGNGAEAKNRADLFLLTLGVAEAVIGGLISFAPEAVAGTTFAPYLLPLGAPAGLAGAAVLIGAQVGVRGLAPHGLAVRLAGVVFPLGVAFNLALGGVWSGVLSWCAMAVAVLVSGRAAARREERDGGRETSGAAHVMPSTNLERDLEAWTWLLMLLVLGLSVLAGSNVFGHPMVANAFVLAASALNGVLHWGLRGCGSPAARIYWHLVFLTAAIGVLMIDRGPLGRVFLALLALVPAFGTWALGVTSGTKLLGLGLAVVVLGDLATWQIDGQPVMQTAVEMGVALLVLLAAGLAGVRIAADRARLAAILEVTTDYVAIADARRRVIYLNESARNLLGGDARESLSNMDLGRLYPEPARDHILGEAIPAAVRDGAWSGETALLGPDGREVPSLQVILAHKSPFGNVEFLSAIARDITDRKRAEEAQREREVADVLNRTRQRFLQIAAHELRNPMTAVKGVHALIRRHIAAGLPVEGLLPLTEVVEREIDRLSSLLSEMLEAFCVQEGRLQLKREPVDLAQVLFNALKPFDLVAGKHHFVLERTEAGGLWVLGDFNRLEEVFRNLLGNAVKYSPDGGEIRVSMQVRDDVAIVSVRDNGLGIPADQLENVFEGFFRASNLAGRDPGGMGLGLYICKEIMERHGGRIWAESCEGEGATFYVELPVHAAS